jgi:hypothetical protein
MWRATEESSHLDLLDSRYPRAQAISSMKDWYSKHPIEPDITFEEVLQQVETSQKQYQQTSWAILARWLAKLSESRSELTEDTNRPACDQGDDSVD